ncbi:uncharacterized protein B0P05DRAFT_554035 [Gilbertella persicaria]|uniref:uncharacterized protein n=1 Tax=Gilbertella persicaria TaxID=101096 RepID=UPI00221EEB26|nr:uncharacterized protein B0P05DRAFT_554035 [Gilbertella persicaria]KAI8065362.1 hypothetical protein B0P05DRAFT_554035 [Gilbertella persicaria]
MTMATTQKEHRPIPFAVLKIQLKNLVEQHDSSGRGVLFTKDLLTLIDRYEVSEEVTLLTEVQKKAILPYTLSNPDLEMTPDDILNLLKIVCPPLPVASISAPTKPPMRTRSASILKKSMPWKRRPSAVASDIQDKDEGIKEEPINKTPPSTTEEEESEKTEEEQYTNQKEVARYYRRSLKLTQRLKYSEQSLASMARDNEDRIVELQNRVDDMNLEVIRQRKEIQEYKSKEKNSLDQIGALETHISNIQRSETDQKQVYLSIKTLFDEKCQEAQKLHELLRQKEADLEKTEDLLSTFQHEVQGLSEERKRLIELQNCLELELETSAQAHQQLAEQKSENEKLKEIIDTLKTDLDEALYHQSNNSDFSLLSSSSSSLLVEKEDLPTPIKTLENELTGKNEDIRLKYVQDEKDYYKNRATETKKDLDRVQSELDYLRKALDSENRLLVNELAELRRKTTAATTITNNIIPPSSSSTHTTIVNMEESPSTSIPILNSIELNIPEPPIHDLWSPLRLRQYKSVGKKKRTVQDLHEVSRKEQKTA